MSVLKRMFFYLLGFSKRESQLIFIFSSIKQKLSLGSSSHNSFLRCLGLSSSILLIKSAFSKQPSHVSSQSFRIFFKSLTFSFFKSTLFKSICFSEKTKRKKRENTCDLSKLISRQNSTLTVSKFANLLVFFL